MHLFVFRAGTGDRLLRDDEVKLALKATEVYINGVVHLSYAHAAAAS